MSVHLKLRIVLGALLGALLVISLGTALQLREIALAANELLGQDVDVESAAATIEARATTGAVGLSVLAVIALVAGAGVLRALRRGFLARLGALDQAARDIQQGDGARRVAVDGGDELGRIAQALNFALDLRDRGDAEMRGRNREIRALLVALLRRWPRPAAVTGIDGELIASRLSSEEETRLRSLTPQVRKAASILLSRGFVSAAELATDVSFGDGQVLHIRALALGEQRIVGWLAEFGE